jgi:hypothetical protein
MEAGLPGANGALMGKPVKKGKHGVTKEQSRRNDNIQRRRQSSYETDPYLARQEELLRLDMEFHRLQTSGLKVIF